MQQHYWRMYNREHTKYGAGADNIYYRCRKHAKEPPAIPVYYIPWKHIKHTHKGATLKLILQTNKRSLIKPNTKYEHVNENKSTNSTAGATRDHGSDQTNGMTDWLSDGQIHWPTDQPTDQSIYSTDQPIARLVNRPIDLPTDRWTYRPTSQSTSR